MPYSALQYIMKKENIKVCINKQDVLFILAWNVLKSSQSHSTHCLSPRHSADGKGAETKTVLCHLGPTEKFDGITCRLLISGPGRNDIDYVKEAPRHVCPRKGEGARMLREQSVAKQVNMIMASDSSYYLVSGKKDIETYIKEM